MHRSTTARALIICAMVLGLSSMAAPAFAGHESRYSEDGDTEDGYSEEYGSDERAGHGSDLQIEVECDAVEATSHHRISTITVFFADGTEEEIEVDEREYSGTFTETIDHAIAESHKRWVADEAEDCEAEPEPSETPDDETDGDTDGDSADENAADGSDDAGSAGDDDAATSTSRDSGDTTDGDRGTAGGTSATRTASGAGGTGGSVDAASTGGGSAGAAPPSISAGGSGLIVGGNAEVFGMVFHQGIKTCPSGPFKGMPYTNIKDCGDSVLGTRLALTGSGTAVFTVVGLGLVALGTALLRVRRSRGAA